MEKTELRIGDILQYVPEHEYAGCMVVVTEPKSWGAQGYILTPFVMHLCRCDGIAYVRPKFEDVELVGHSPFELKRHPEEENE